MEILIFSILLILENIQAEDLWQTLILMEKLSPGLNNNGCTETIILKAMNKTKEDGILYSLVVKMHQKVTALWIVLITPVQKPLQELLKNLILHRII